MIKCHNTKGIRLYRFNGRTCIKGQEVYYVDCKKVFKTKVVDITWYLMPRGACYYDLADIPNEQVCGFDFFTNYHEAHIAKYRDMVEGGFSIRYTRYVRLKKYNMGRFHRFNNINRGIEIM